MWRSPCTKSQLHSLMFSFQGKLQKHQAFEAEVQANSGAIVKLDETGNQMINESHFASETIRSFTPYRTAQRPIVTATQVGSHMRVGEACGSAVQLVFAVSPSFLGWQFAPSFWAVLGALSSLETSLIELSEWTELYPPMTFKKLLLNDFQVSGLDEQSVTDNGWSSYFPVLQVVCMCGRVVLLFVVHKVYSGFQ